jgi:hypothetical protein
MNTGSQPASMAQYRPFMISLLLLGVAVWVATMIGTVGLYPLIVFAPIFFTSTLLVFYFFGLKKTDRFALWQIAASIKFFKSDKGFSKN